jgi:hypothetical protein
MMSGIGEFPEAVDDVVLVRDFDVGWRAWRRVSAVPSVSKRR